MEIDWSKAPGAQFYCQGDFYKKQDDGWYWSCGNGQWSKSDYASPDNFSWWGHAIKAPEPWNGEGLPPVGTEVEALLPALGNARYWQLAKVVHGPLPDSPSEILVFSLENTKPSWVDEFRPFRTPEQIAAEEREKAIDEMFNAIHPGDRQVAIVNGFYAALKKHLGDIYDAGYRKQEPKPE